MGSMGMYLGIGLFAMSAGFWGGIKLAEYANRPNLVHARESIDEGIKDL